jgi:hypothetical protein
LPFIDKNNDVFIISKTFGNEKMYFRIMKESNLAKKLLEKTKNGNK